MKNIYLFLLSVVILCSCNDFLDREPKTNLSPGSFWKSEEDLRLAANVFYQNMNRSYTLDNQSADGFANVGNLVSSGTHAPAILMGYGPQPINRYDMLIIFWRIMRKLR